MWDYTYDNRNQMVSATLKVSGTVSERVTFHYDAFGNLIERDAFNGSTTTTTKYELDGWDPAKPTPVGNENFDTWAELDGSNTLVTRRENGTSFDEAIASQNAAGSVSWDLDDRQNSVRMVIDNSASVLATSTFSATGVLTAGTLSSGPGFAGMRWDGTLTLYADGNGQRFLDPNTDRFLSTDPKEFGPGYANLYEYASNGPTNATDPSGDAIITDYKEAAEALITRIAALSGAELGPPRQLPSGKWIIDSVPSTDPRYGKLLDNARNSEAAMKSGQIDQATGINRYNLLIAGMDGTGMNLYLQSPGLVEGVSALMDALVWGKDAGLSLTPTDDTTQRFGWLSRGVGTLQALSRTPPATASGAAAWTYTLPSGKVISGQEYVLQMRCAVCHGSANGDWKNIVAFPDQLNTAPLYQQYAVLTTPWAEMDAKYWAAVKRTAVAGVKLPLAVAETGFGTAMTAGGAPAGPFVMFHGLDMGGSAFVDFATEGQVQRESLTRRVFLEALDLSESEKDSFEFALGLASGNGRATGFRASSSAPGVQRATFGTGNNFPGTLNRPFTGDFADLTAEIQKTFPGFKGFKENVNIPGGLPARFNPATNEIEFSMSFNKTTKGLVGEEVRHALDVGEGFTVPGVVAAFQKETGLNPLNNLTTFQAWHHRRVYTRMLRDAESGSNPVMSKIVGKGDVDSIYELYLNESFGRSPKDWLLQQQFPNLYHSK